VADLEAEFAALLGTPTASVPTAATKATKATPEDLAVAATKSIKSPPLSDKTNVERTTPNVVLGAAEVKQTEDLQKPTVSAGPTVDKVETLVTEEGSVGMLIRLITCQWPLGI
jgi:hypothetical protein